MGDEETVKGTRGAGFPALSLPDAVEIVRRAAAHGRQHALAAMATYAGHATSNSGPFRRKLAALKDWGLVTTTSSAVTITETGMGIVLPSSPDAALGLQMDAFQGCSIFWRFYTEGAKEVPLPAESISNTAVTAYGVGVGAKEIFTKSFIESAALVGLAEKLPNGAVKLLSIGPQRAIETAASTSGYDTEAQESGPEPTYPSQTQPAAPVIRQVWSGEGTEIILEVHSRTPLTATAFMQMGSTVTAIEELWQMLQSGE
jgi:hypothetical protein